MTTLSSIDQLRSASIARLTKKYPGLTILAWEKLNQWAVIFRRSRSESSHYVAFSGTIYECAQLATGETAYHIQYPEMGMSVAVAIVDLDSDYIYGVSYVASIQDGSGVPYSEWSN